MLAKDRESDNLYLYNKEKTILYFDGLSKDFSLLGIYALNLKKLADTGQLYLGKYMLTTSKIPAAVPSNISVSELVEQLTKDRRDLNVSTGKGKGVALLVLESNKTLTFKSLKSCSEYLTSIGLSVTSHTLKSRIASGEEYKGHLVM